MWSRPLTIADIPCLGVGNIPVDIYRIKRRRFVLSPRAFGKTRSWFPIECVVDLYKSEVSLIKHQPVLIFRSSSEGRGLRAGTENNRPSTIFRGGPVVPAPGGEVVFLPENWHSLRPILARDGGKMGTHHFKGTNAVYAKSVYKSRCIYKCSYTTYSVSRFLTGIITRKMLLLK